MVGEKREQRGFVILSEAKDLPSRVSDSRSFVASLLRMTTCAFGTKPEPKSNTRNLAKTRTQRPFPTATLRRFSENLKPATRVVSTSNYRASVPRLCFQYG